MNKKSLPGNGAAAPVPEWNPQSKEPWFFEFQKEPVNDDKWSCIVTAAVRNEAEDEETTKIYTECVNTGLRKAVRVISMADVVKLLKENNEGNNTKKEVKRSKKEKPAKKTPLKAQIPPRAQVVALAAKYATYTATECVLPPELMAAVLKFMILNLKDESCLQKKTDAVWERKVRQENIKGKFVRDLKPFEGGTNMLKPYREVRPNILGLEEPINDEPVAGPDLYILLTDFYSAFYFSELHAINVPFLAVLKITDLEKPVSTSETDTTTGEGRKSGIGAFWKSLKECEVSGKFEDIAVMEYRLPSKSEDTIENYMTVFDELTWMQYSVYCVYRQHQKYLQELQEQRLILSVEPLDLSKCEIYNKLCDALITGEPLTPLLVLYAIVEQVVAGVPETESLVLELRPKPTDFFALSAALGDENLVPLVTPRRVCGRKSDDCFTVKEVQNMLQSSSSEEEDWIETSYENTEHSMSLSTHLGENSISNSKESVFTTPETFETLINKVLSERKTEKELRDDKKWKTPILCFYGDSVRLQTHYCDSRLFDSRTVVDRFFRNSAIPLLWKNYPELSPEERALCNFHFSSFRKLSNDTEDVVKLKLSFTLSMNLIRRTQPRGEYFEKSETEDEEGRIDVRLSQDLIAQLKNKNNFPNYFLRTFILGMKRVEDVLESICDKDSQFQCCETSVLRMTHSNTSSDSISSTPTILLRQFDIPMPQSPSDDDKSLLNLYSILNCSQISTLFEPCLQNGGRDNLIEDFKFYENLEPDLMIQRLVEAKENFNAVQSSYFSPTDTLVVVMYNECDERGILQTTESGVMATPVGLKDFYRYVYPEIRNWLVEEVEDHARFMSELKERTKAREEKKDAEYLAFLKRKYCKMSEEKRKEFLEKTVISEPEVGDEELGELPVKPKPVLPNKVSFVGTNYAEVRVENRAKIREFHSQDGTEVSATIDSWLYTSSELLKIRIKRSKFLLYYNQWLGKTETNPNFTFQTFSGMIFSFYKDTDVDLNYSVTISWPTGLLIRPVLLLSGVYIRQTYLEPYRTGWEIEEENSRCFLKNGQVVVMKKNGDYDVLCGSGTKYSFYESATVPRYEIVSTTGEVWQIRTKGPCKNRRTQITVNKVFLGVDQNTKETFYKREDGTHCMLWPNGILVTNYPDGTKITSTPYFDEEEVTVDWTEEEKLYFEELELKQRLEQEQRSRTILRNSSSPRTSRKMSNLKGFVSVSCAYLMEHPKYSSVNFNPNDPFVKIRMPEEITVVVYPDGNYEVWHNRSFLTVRGSTVEFHMNCPDCKGESTATLYLDSSLVLCKCVDFFQKAFFVYGDGRTNFQECYDQTEGGEAAEGTKVNPEKCSRTHHQGPSLKQRCFALDRDLSGTEFIHSDCLAHHFQLPEETHFELHTEDEDSISHTFNSRHYKVGHENWVMSYEDSSNSLPTNLKRKDLKEIGVKQVSKNFFKHPFPKHHNCGRQHNNKGRRNVRQPKVIVSRTVTCLDQDPKYLMAELQKCVQAYQRKAFRIFDEYKNHTVVNDRSYDSRYVEMRLRKIALTLSQSLKQYPHLCTNSPSTEKDIHYFGHFINSRHGMKADLQDDRDFLPDCKQIPNRFPKSSDIPCIYEENEPPCNA